MMVNKKAREEGVAKRSKMFMAYFNRDEAPPLLGDRVRAHGAVDDLGKGYTDVELRKTFSRHCLDVEDEILRKAGIHSQFISCSYLRSI